MLIKHFIKIKNIYYKAITPCEEPFHKTIHDLDLVQGHSLKIEFRNDGSAKLVC